MSPIQIGPPVPNPERQSPWSAYGLLDNPFPTSGVNTVADYEEHQKEQVAHINEWLASVVKAETKRWAPLVLKGSVGVGKTHVLRRIERVLVDYRDKVLARTDSPATLAVSSHTLPGISSRSLLLSNILQEGLRAGLDGAEPDVDRADFPLLRASLRRLFENPGFEYRIPSTSPIFVPLQSLRKERQPAKRDELTRAFISWIARRDVPRSMLERLGVRGRLEGEGESVRAYAHVALLAHQCVGLRAWVILLDQIEDLWRANEVTPVKRARFLTDLRTLIDEALLGAPIAVVLAWNTDVVEGTRRRPAEVENPLKTEYVALWSRLPSPLDVPPLPPEHVLPFASAYVNVAHQAYIAANKDSIASLPHPGSFTTALTKDLSELVRKVPDYGRLPDGSVIERMWLRTLREWADKFVLGSG